MSLHPFQEKTSPFQSGTPYWAWRAERINNLLGSHFTAEQAKAAEKMRAAVPTGGMIAIGGYLGFAPNARTAAFGPRITPSKRTDKTSKTSKRTDNARVGDLFTESIM